MLAYEVELLRRFKPEVVVDHDINGEYGHGVHMLNTWILQQAVEQSGDVQYFPESARNTAHSTYRRLICTCIRKTN